MCELNAIVRGNKSSVWSIPFTHGRTERY